LQVSGKFEDVEKALLLFGRHSKLTGFHLLVVQRAFSRYRRRRRQHLVHPDNLNSEDQARLRTAVHVEQYTQSTNRPSPKGLKDPTRLWLVLWCSCRYDRSIAVRHQLVIEQQLGTGASGLSG
jgi:hypothetical protein